MRLRYDYKCEKCGHVMEVSHRISEEPDVVCPKCSGAMRKYISPESGANIVFKGWWPDKERRRGDEKYDPPNSKKEI